MKTIRILTIMIALVAFSSCDKGGGGDDPSQKEDKIVEFVFSAAESKYASLMESVTIKVEKGGNKTVSVDWGDGTLDSGVKSVFSHRYSKAGNYTVKAEASDVQNEWQVEISSLLALSEALENLYANPGKVWVMAHRSHTSDHSVPENSVAAVAAAVAAGADVVETDTHRTVDGQIVISHDESINAHTDGQGKITQMRLSFIKTCHLTDRDGNVTSETMPTLEEFLLAARGKVYVNLDYSPRTASTKEVFSVVRKLGMVQQVLMFCKNEDFVKQVFAQDPDANAYAASEYYSSLVEGKNRYFLQVGWNSGLSSRSDCVVRCADAYAAGVLCSVNLLHVNHEYIPEFSIDESQVTGLFDLYPECQMIQTDCPKELIELLSRKGKR